MIFTPCVRRRCAGMTKIPIDPFGISIERSSYEFFTLSKRKERETPSKEEYLDAISS